MKGLCCILFSVLLFFSNCKDAKQQQHPEDQIVITPGNPSNFIDDLSPYLDTMIVLPLETNQQSLISSISKMLILPDESFIVSTPTSILMFDAEGKYIRTLGQKGRGPEEYYGAEDICLDQENKILNILAPDNQVIGYNIGDGSFAFRTPARHPSEQLGFEAIASGPEGSFFLYCGENRIKESRENHTLFHFSSEGKLLHSDLPCLDYPINMYLITQTYDNRYILRPQNQDNVCYYLNDSLPNPRLRIDFGEKTLSNRYSPDLQTYLRSDYYKMPIYIHETADQLFFTFCGAGAWEHYCIHSFSNDKTIVWKRKGSDTTNMLLIIGSDKEFFYGLYLDYRAPEEIPLDETDLLKREIVQRTRIQLQEDSNPCLIKIKFKI